MPFSTGSILTVLKSYATPVGSFRLGRSGCGYKQMTEYLAKRFRLRKVCFVLMNCTFTIWIKLYSRMAT